MTACRSVLFTLLLVSAAGVHADIYSANDALSRGDFKTAVDEFKRLADQGDAKAQAQLGFMYYTGEGVAQNYAEAVKWYQKAAAQGDRDAQYNLAVAYAFGEGIPQDYPQAALWYRRAGEQGHAEAQYSLGLSYSYGEGVAQDPIEATKWFRKAAEQGYVRAQVQLGSKYHTGDGVPQDYKEAVKWYRMAADRGDPVAQYNLGSLYRSGMGVEKDYNQALRWFRLSADRGYAAAQSELASLERAIAAQSRPRPASPAAPAPAVTQTSPAAAPPPAAPQAAPAGTETTGREALFAVDKSDLLTLDKSQSPDGTAPPVTESPAPAAPTASATATASAPAPAPEPEPATAVADSTAASEPAMSTEESETEKKSGVGGFFRRLFRPTAKPPEPSVAETETSASPVVEPGADSEPPAAAAEVAAEATATGATVESELLAMESVEPALPDTTAPPAETLLSDQSAATSAVSDAPVAEATEQEEPKRGFFKRLFSRDRETPATETATADVPAESEAAADASIAMAETETAAPVDEPEIAATEPAAPNGAAAMESPVATEESPAAAEEAKPGFFKRLFNRKPKTEAGEPATAGADTAVAHAADISNGVAEPTPLESPEPASTTAAATPAVEDSLAVDLGPAAAQTEAMPAADAEQPAAPEPVVEESADAGKKPGFFKRLFGRDKEEAAAPAESAPVPEEDLAMAAPETESMATPGAEAVPTFTAEPGELNAAIQAVNAGKYADAFPALRSLATQGDAAAQFQVGTLYHQGLGIERDLSAAAQWYRRSAEQGNANAQYSLANMYLMGEGLEQDDGKARVWYEKAAAQGHDGAQHNLSNLQKMTGKLDPDPDGKGAAEATPEAAQAASEPELGTAETLENEPGFFSRLFASDEVATDQADSETAAPAASEPQEATAPLPEAQQAATTAAPEPAPAVEPAATAEGEEKKGGIGGFFGRLFGGEEDEAAQEQETAAELDLGPQVATAEPAATALEAGGPALPESAEGAYQKAIAYSTGEGVDQDAVLAFEMFQVAAEMGHPAAQYKVGAAYAYGEGTAKDLAMAAQWYQKAAAQGYAIAQRSLGSMYMNGEGVQQDKRVALAWYSILAATGNVMDVRRRDMLIGELSETEVAEAQQLAAGLKAEINATR